MALLVGMTVLAILIAAVLPLASAQAQRGREEELVFRGLQFAEGIRVFRRRYRRYPTSLKEMLDVRPRTLRKVWKDPMTGTDEWGLITMTSAQPVAGLRPGGSASPLGVVPRPTPAPTSPFSKSGGPASGGVMGPVLGVHSRSTKKGFRIWNGKESYSEWRFTEETLTATFGAAAVAGPPGPGIGGGGRPVAPPGGGTSVPR